MPILVRSDTPKDRVEGLMAGGMSGEIPRCGYVRVLTEVIRLVGGRYGVVL